MNITYRPYTGGRKRRGDISHLCGDAVVVCGPRGFESVPRANVICRLMPCGGPECAEFGPRECAMRGEGR